MACGGQRLRNHAPLWASLPRSTSQHSGGSGRTPVRPLKGAPHPPPKTHPAPGPPYPARGALRSPCSAPAPPPPTREEDPRPPRPPAALMAGRPHAPNVQLGLPATPPAPNCREDPHSLRRSARRKRPKKTPTARRTQPKKTASRPTAPTTLPPLAAVFEHQQRRRMAQHEAGS